jgi:hypothetical protein
VLHVIKPASAAHNLADILISAIAYLLVGVAELKA